MHHGKQVVVPAFLARAPVAMADEGLRADQRPKAGNFGIVHVPDGHAVVPVAEAVMVGHGGDAADRALGLQLLQELQGGVDTDLQSLGQPAPGILDQRQPALGEHNQAFGQLLLLGGVKRRSASRHGKSPPWAG